jgi:hypothetical protein
MLELLQNGPSWVVSHVIHDDALEAIVHRNVSSTCEPDVEWEDLFVGGTLGGEAWFGRM